ncbi:MAG: prepilin-type N-terminal cleavage/methylation domain-containing protein [Gemmatimonadota bacterium]|nr:prepilin-type N-terminal cleavage/methylation domain-containing protein [Gemmatimonadota bacterium]
MLNTWRSLPASGPRRGFTLVEILTVMVLLGFVIAGLTAVIVNQQRFYTGTSEIIETRGSVRELSELVPSELRGISPKSSDIYAMGASSIDYRANLGASLVCAGILGTTIVLPPLGKNNALTVWLSAPQVSDTLLVYDSGTKPDTSDDAWRVHVVTSAPIVGVCPITTGFTSTVLEQANGISLGISPALNATEVVGSAIRFVRHSRLQLYAAADGRYYLGFYDCNASRGCGTVQPVSGPYLPPGSYGGLVFTYYDINGAVTVTPANVRRIGVVARSQSRDDVRIAGHAAGLYADSTSVVIAVRN